MKGLLKSAGIVAGLGLVLVLYLTGYAVGLGLMLAVVGLVLRTIVGLAFGVWVPQW